MSVVLKFIRELGPYKLAGAVGGFLLLCILLVVGAMNMSSRDMAVLYSDLEPSDSNQIVQELELQNIPYEVLAGGTIIKAPQDRVLKLRMFMAQEGLPARGSIVGYEIFDKEEALGTTNFMQNVRLVRALEGELSRTIASFDQIDKVRVHLVIPQREIFSRDRQEPRASIAVKLKGSRTLGKNEINSISHLAATAVPGLDVKNITIVDTKGRPLKLSAGEDDEYGAGGNSQEQKLSYELAMKRRLEALLEQMLGAGKATVQVSADLNFDRIVSNSETYDPDSAVVRSVQSMEESEKTPVGDQDSLDVSVANNLPGGFGGDAGEGGLFATSVKRDETTNYEISKVIQNKISESGTVSHLSVAVVVDGHYNIDAETGEATYQQRTEDEISQIEAIVKTAVGFQEKRDDQVQVMSMQFITDLESLEQDDTQAWLREELPSLLQTLILAVVVTLIVVMVIRPLALRAFDTTAPVDAFGIPTRSGGGEKPATFSAAKEASTPPAVRKINDVIASYPQETMIVLRKWLNK